MAYKRNWTKLVKSFTGQANILKLKTIRQLESGDFMIDLIVLVLLILLAIYAHKKHAAGEKLITKPLRFFIFPVHWWLRNAILKFTGSNFITGIIWFFAGIFIFLLFIPVYVINKTAGFIFAYYLESRHTLIDLVPLLIKQKRLIGLIITASAITNNINQYCWCVFLSVSYRLC